MSIGITTAVLFAVFAALLFLGCPISVGIVISSIVAAVSSLSWDQITFITMQKMNSGVESFSLLAIPLFILAVKHIAQLFHIGSRFLTTADIRF